MPDEAIAKRDDRRELVLSECKELAQVGTPPSFIPKEVMSAEDWGALSEDDRRDAAFTYRWEIVQSLDHFKPQFPVIKTPQGTTLLWTLPDGTFEPTVSGIILGHFPARGWWKSQDITNSLPDCSSIDGIVPEKQGPTGAKVCAECPYDKFGSDPKGGDGKACKERINVFFLRPGGAIPWKLSVPPTGLSEYNAYVTSLVDGRPPKALAAVVTTFGLQKARGKRGHEYAQIRLSIDRVLPYKDMMVGIRIRERFVTMMREHGVTVSDLPVDGAGEKPTTAHGTVIDHNPDEGPPRGDEEAPGDLRL